jgi:hypothetical protein
MAEKSKNDEKIIRQHRRWTRWVVGNRAAGEGNLILTNKRLLFLHRIPSSPDIADTIKKLACAPMNEVLDHALSLHKYNFQIPLISIVHSGVAVFFQFPFPHFCLRVSYLQGKNMNVYTVAFQFLRPLLDMVIRPQFVEDSSWGKSIHRAIEEESPEEVTNET